jgi:hypothetical protein
MVVEVSALLQHLLCLCVCVPACPPSVLPVAVTSCVLYEARSRTLWAAGCYLRQLDVHR